MAMAFSAKFDVHEIDELKRRLSYCPREAKNAVRKSNRSFASKLRDYIRPEAPAGSSKEGPRHDTPHGAGRRSIRSGATADRAYVKGGGGRAPHFVVNEFGGGVRWVSRRGRSHGIPIKPRNADGYFFFPTGRRHVPEMQRDATEAAMRVMQEQLGSM